MSDDRFLVTGAGGLVGSHLVRALAGRDVVATFHRATDPEDQVLDVTDAGAVSELVRETRPTVILHAAADPFVERCEREPEATRAVNVAGTRNVATAAQLIGARLVVFSSDYVFDGTRGEYKEDDAIGPLNEYGRQKVEIERIARTVRHLICRTSGVFGHEAARKNFVLQLVDALRAGRRFRVPSDQVITATDGRSLADAVLELLDGGHEGVFHVVGPQPMLRPEFARRVARAFGLDAALLDPLPTASLGLAAARPLAAGLSDGKLRAVLGHGLTAVDEALDALAREGA